MYGLVAITLTARQLAGHCLVHALQPGHNLATFCKLVFTASALSTRLERHHACRVQQYIQIVLCTFWLSGLYLQLL